MRRSVPLFLLAVVWLFPPSTVRAQMLPDVRDGLPEAPVRYEDDYLSADFHRGRRQELMDALPSGSLAVILGGIEEGGSIDDLAPFVQDPSLYYLTGSPEPGTALLLAPGGVEVDGATVHEILFVPPRSPDREIWTGRRFGPRRAEGRLGVELALPYDRFDEIVGTLAADSSRGVFTTPPPVAAPPRTMLARQAMTLALAAQDRGAPVDDETLQGLLNRMRMVKGAEEVRLLRRAASITADAHRAVLAQVRPGWKEYEIEALIEYIFAREGAERPGFPSIVGSGENSVLLHYDTNRRTTQTGDLVVMDIGASYHGYTADVTRTIPVSGSFTDDQRAIYDIVLEAQEAGIRAIRAGAPYSAPSRAAVAVLAKGLAKLGLIDGPMDMAGLQRFFPHAVGHYLGLEVHDVGTYGTLEPGVVVTVEPGIYIRPSEDVDPRWWNLGVRIEDDVLVTDGDPEVLSAGAPKDPGEIEALMRPAEGS
jgi:Xaa-Pro aminopeptidase